MKCVTLQQKSPQWHHWRENGVTATDTPVILGLNEKKTPWQLWAEKVHLVAAPDLSNVPAVRWGIEHEDVARKIYEQRFNEILLPLCATYDANPIFRASFDGIDSNGMPVEIKCPGEKTILDVRTRKRDSDAFKLYYGQVQHQIMVAEADKARLIFYDPKVDDIIGFEILRDQAFIERIIKEGIAFFDCVRQKREPTRDPTKDLYIPSGVANVDQWLKTAQNYLRCEEQIEQLKEQLQALERMQNQFKEEFKAQMGHNALVDFGGVRITKSEVSGRVDYKRMVSDLLGHDPTQEDIAKYQKDGTTQWRFRATGSASLSIIDETILSDIKAKAKKLKVVENPLWF